MIKPIQTSSSNLNVLAEGELSKVVGGCGRHYRPRRRHCWGWRPRFDYRHEGFESRRPEGGFESEPPEFIEEPSSIEEETTETAPAV